MTRHKMKTFCSCNNEINGCKASKISLSFFDNESLYVDDIRTLALVINMYVKKWKKINVKYNFIIVQNSGK